LRDNGRDWDAIDLRSNGPPASDGGRVRRSMQIVGLLTGQVPERTTSLVEISGTWDDYLRTLSSEVQHEIHHALRLTSEHHDVEVLRHRPAPARDGDGDPRWDLYELCEQVAQVSQQTTPTAGGTLSHERVRAFLRDAHEVAARNGMLDVSLLKVGGQPAAFTYNYYYNGRVTGLRMGYDPSLGDSGLASALLLRSMEDSFARGDSSYDLGRDEFLFGRQLRTRTETSYRLTYWPPSSWRSQAVRIARWAKRRWQRPTEEFGKSAAV
jgi:hypothetical protein